MHFDPRLPLVVDRFVLEGLEVEGSVEFAIDAGEDVQIEGGGDALGVVIGGKQHVERFVEIRADEESGVVAEQATRGAQEKHGLGAGEVADGRSGENPTRKVAGQRQLQPVEVVKAAEDGMNVKPGKGAGDAPCGRVERGGGDLDWDVSGGCSREPKRSSVLRLEPEPNSTTAAPSGHQFADLWPASLEKGDLGARRIVFGERRDLLEQFGAARIVEKAAGQALLAVPTAHDRTSLRKSSTARTRNSGNWTICPIVMRRPPRRKPMNCQR